MMRCVGNIRLLRVIVAVLCAYAGLGYRAADASWLSQTMGEKSIYSLNKVEEASDDAISVSLHKDGVFETVNYKLSLKQTIFGDEQGDASSELVSGGIRWLF